MSTLDPEPPDPPAASEHPAGNPVPAARRRPPWRRALRWALVLGGALALVGATGLVGAEYYTSRPVFCNSCHVMNPYYESWSRDKHAHEETDAWCVDCHYAPGQQHTIKAKFKGLSQVASYFSGRYGSSRPRAHVDDASCLRSKCHGDGEYLSRTLLIGQPRTEKRLVGDQETEVQRTPTVKFVHEKHLKVDVKLTENEHQLGQLRARLKQSLSAAGFERVQAVAHSVQPPKERHAELRKVLAELELPDLMPDALELMRLEHLNTRLRQLSGLNCAACHSYNATGDSHVLAADLQTCFTCHFNNQEFNRGTGECLTCHEPPVRQILVHDQTVSVLFPDQGQATTREAQPVLMDHRDIVSRNIDCASCHLDVIQGQATVSARDCANCHDQQRYLEGFEQRDTARVAEYHETHVAQQRARCADCHRTIRHELINPVYVGTSPDFLRPVLNDCQHCHPNHHHEQVSLLMGVGGVGMRRPMPNAMFGSRVNCAACHNKPATDLKGDELVKASEATCIGCHGADYERMFEQWHNEVSNYLKEAEATLARVEASIADRQARGLELPAGVAERLSLARENIRLVRAGNGIHNKNFALELLELSIRSLDDAMGQLTAR